MCLCLGVYACTCVCVYGCMHVRIVYIFVYMCDHVLFIYVHTYILIVYMCVMYLINAYQKLNVTHQTKIKYPVKYNALTLLHVHGNLSFNHLHALLLHAFHSESLH